MSGLTVALVVLLVVGAQGFALMLAAGVLGAQVAYVEAVVVSVLARIWRNLP